jgi:signal transduction histidine kinase
VARLAVKERRAVSSPDGVAIPLITVDRLEGALVLADRLGRAFLPEELRLLEAVADQKALALESARHYATARERLARLRETQVQLVEAAKMSALGQLVSGVAHELNNPLSVIIGYGQLLLARDLPADTRRSVDLMVTQGDRMAEIIRNLLYFSGQRPPQRTHIDIGHVIAQTLILRESHLTLSGITVERDFAPALPLIAADPQQLEQVFLNLLLNAEQAILDGKTGGRLVVQTRLKDGGAAIEARVIDDGPGIPAAALARVFEPFFTTKTVGMGTGLGLSVSYGIVEEHGGRLSVQSEPGRTVFTVELPAVGLSPAESEAPAVIEGPIVRTDGRVALVAEDEATVVDLVVALLGTTGWRVDTVSGGQAALDRLRAQRYDLIVSDLRMPDGSGEDLYRHAVAHDPALAGRFLFITGDSANREAWEFFQTTRSPVIEKPFRPAAFLEAVRKIAATPRE